MKIGIACTNAFTVPLPVGEIYANQEMAGWIADELARKGFDATLFAPIGSKTKAKLVTFGMRPYSDPKIHRVFSAGCSFSDYEHLFMAKIYNYAAKNNFDVLHMNLRPLSVVPFSAMSDIPTVQTLHDPLYYEYFRILKRYNEFKQISFVSISRSQRKALPKLRFSGNVYNGISLDQWKFHSKTGEYLCWAGRVLPEKGPHIAIRAAKRLGLPLKMAGFVYNIDKENKKSYWNKEIKPFLGGNITLDYLPSRKRNSFYGNARAFINTLQWEEPFGLVMIEAMACGTPVIGFRRAAVPEIVKDGKTGFIVKDEREMVKAIKKIDEIKREDCRQRVEKYFSVEKMADGYEKVYERVINNFKK